MIVTSGNRHGFFQFIHDIAYEMLSDTDGDVEAVVKTAAASEFAGKHIGDAQVIQQLAESIYMRQYLYHSSRPKTVWEDDIRKWIEAYAPTVAVDEVEEVLNEAHELWLSEYYSTAEVA